MRWRSPHYYRKGQAMDEVLEKLKTATGRTFKAMQVGSDWSLYEVLEGGILKPTGLADMRKSPMANKIEKGIWLVQFLRQDDGEDNG